MGAGATGTVPATIEEEVAAFTACLPMAEQLNGGLFDWQALVVTSILTLFWNRTG
jgi:hypothetical protein